MLPPLRQTRPDPSASARNRPLSRAARRTPLPWRRAALVPALAAGALAAGAPAWADPTASVFRPEVEAGVREFELRLGSAHPRHAPREAAASFSLEWGVNRWWSTELGLEVEREGGGPTRLASYEWENRLQLTQSPDAPWQFGLLLEVERERGSGGGGPADAGGDEAEGRGAGWSLRYGPLLQREWGARRLNLNLLFERRFEDGPQARTQLGYQWQFRPRHDARLDLGLQGLGELGRWDRWAPRAQQSHALGPVLFLRLGDGPGDADDDADAQDDGSTLAIGCLFGTGGAAARQTWRLQASLPF